MNIIIDITHRIKVNVPDNINPNKVLSEMTTSFSWPEDFQANCFSEEIMDKEIVDIKLPPIS